MSCILLTNGGNRHQKKDCYNDTHGQCSFLIHSNSFCFYESDQHPDLVHLEKTRHDTFPCRLLYVLHHNVVYVPLQEKQDMVFNDPATSVEQLGMVRCVKAKRSLKTLLPSTFPTRKN